MRVECEARRLQIFTSAPEGAQEAPKMLKMLTISDVAPSGSFGAAASLGRLASRLAPLVIPRGLEMLTGGVSVPVHLDEVNTVVTDQVYQVPV